MKRMRNYVIEQFLHGQWVELININSTEELSDEQFYEGLESLTLEIFKYNGDEGKMRFINPTNSIIFRPMDGPIRLLQGSYYSGE